MKRMENEYREASLKVIWIGFQDRPERLKRFASKLGLESVGFDKDNAVARDYGINYGAGVVIIDGTGMVRKRLSKGFGRVKLIAALEEVLK